MDLFSKAAGLAIVFGLLALWVWAAKRAGGRLRLPFDRRGSGSDTLLRNEASLSLSAQHRLYVVALEGRRFLVLTAPGGGSMVDLASGSSFLPAFADALGAAQDSRKEQA